MKFYDQKINDILINSGWAENRKIDSEIIIDNYRSFGYPIFNNVIEFMQNFYGLKINFLNKKNGKNDNIDFNLLNALDLEAIERLQDDYEPRINKKLCIIGTAYRDYLVIMMTEDGHIYSGYDNYFSLISLKIEEAIGALINCENFVEIEKKSY